MLVYVSEKEMRNLLQLPLNFWVWQRVVTWNKERETCLGRAERVAEVLDRDSGMEDKKTVPETELWRIQNI